MPPKEFSRSSETETSRNSKKEKSKEAKKFASAKPSWLTTALVGGLALTAGMTGGVGAAEASRTALHPHEDQCSSTDLYAQSEVCGLTENRRHLMNEAQRQRALIEQDQASEIEPKVVVEAMSENPEMIGKIVKAMSENPGWTKSLESAMKNNPNIENTLKAAYQKFKEEEASSPQQKSRDVAGLFGPAMILGGAAIVVYTINKRIKKGRRSNKAARRSTKAASYQLHG